MDEERLISACPGLPDQRLHRRRVGHAAQNLVADDETGRAVDAQRFGQLQVAIDGCLDGRVPHARLETRDVQADFGGDLEHGGFGNAALGTHQRPVERLVPALAVGGESRLGREDRPTTQDREFLRDDTELRVGGASLLHHRRYLAAVGAIVVEEFDQRDVALGVAANRTRRIAKKLVGPRRQSGFGLARLGLKPARLQMLKGLDDDLGVGEQVVANTPLELFLGHLARNDRDLGRRNAGQHQSHPRTWRICGRNAPQACGWHPPAHPASSSGTSS